LICSSGTIYAWWTDSCGWLVKIHILFIKQVQIDINLKIKQQVRPANLAAAERSL
jgi:hypothetical protein